MKVDLHTTFQELERQVRQSRLSTTFKPSVEMLSVDHPGRAFEHPLNKHEGVEVT